MDPEITYGIHEKNQANVKFSNNMLHMSGGLYIIRCMYKVERIEKITLSMKGALYYTGKREDNRNKIAMACSIYRDLENRDGIGDTENGDNTRTLVGEETDAGRYSCDKKRQKLNAFLNSSFHHRVRVNSI